MEIIAHRGASHYAPENTLAAFKKALELGVDSIELDVRLTKDEVPVLCHDASINRTSNGKGFIHQLTVDELKQYDFSSTFRKQGFNEKIPTLAEALELFQNIPITIHVEIKNGPTIPERLEEKIAELIANSGMEKQVVYSSFDHHALQRMKQINRHARIGLLFHINLLHLFHYIDQLPFQIESIHVNHFYITAEMIEQARDRGIKVNGYTVNDATFALAYKKLGLDGLITNNPLILKE